MLKLVAYISDLSYLSILNLLIPGIDRSAAAKGIVKLVPNSWKDELALLITTLNQEKIIKEVNTQLKRKSINISVAQIDLSKFRTEGSRMLRLEVILDEIDYNGLVKNTVPKILENMAQSKDSNGALAKLLLEKNLPVKMLTAALDTLSQEEKDELVVSIFNIYKGDIKEALYRVLEQQNISLDIEKLRLDTYKPV